MEATMRRRRDESRCWGARTRTRRPRPPLPAPLRAPLLPTRYWQAWAATTTGPAAAAGPAAVCRQTGRCGRRPPPGAPSASPSGRRRWRRWAGLMARDGRTSGLPVAACLQAEHSCTRGPLCLDHCCRKGCTNTLHSSYLAWHLQQQPPPCCQVTALLRLGAMRSAGGGGGGAGSGAEGRARRGQQGR